MLTFIPFLGKAAHEQNMWPIWVTRCDPSTQAAETQYIGPLFFKGHNRGETYSGFRPLIYRHHDKTNRETKTALLYPIYRYQQDPSSSRWSIFSLINSTSSNLPGDLHQGFDVWPFYFSRQTGDPDTSYRGLFPLMGSIKNRFGYDQLNWTLFPFYWESSKRGVVTRSTPWPFIKNSAGNGHEGLSIWPLYGHAEKPDEYEMSYWLWPIFFHTEKKLSSSKTEKFNAVFPFYTASHRPGRRESNMLLLWGNTDQTTPVAYHENRYLWPLLVQRRGSQNYINRWAPFYTHSIRQGTDKTWVLWPLWRQASWDEQAIRRERQQFFWFIYWNETQSDLRNSDTPQAHKTHLWPLLSTWDNGAGQKQAQFPSPLAVFFSHNEHVRKIYSPLFSLYRYDQKSPENIRWSLLWNAVTWRKTSDEREFHLGPLYSTEHSSQGRRIALLNGLLSLRKHPETDRWKLSFFDFKPLESQKSPTDDDR